jgi:hypothetical protein
LNVAIGLFLEHAASPSAPVNRGTTSTTTSSANIPPPLTSSFAEAAASSAASNYQSLHGYRAPDRAVHDVLMDDSDVHEMYSGVGGGRTGNNAASSSAYSTNIWNQRELGDDDADFGDEGERNVVARDRRGVRGQSVVSFWLFI